MELVLGRDIFFRAAATQARVVLALVLRDMKARFAHSRVGFVWYLAGPTAIIVFHGIYLRMIGRTVPDHAYFGFAANGYLVYFAWSYIVYGCKNSQKQNRPLFMFPDVKPLDTIYSLTVVETFAMIMYGLIFFPIAGLIEPPIFPTSPGKVIEAIAAIAILGMGFGLISLSIETVFKNYDKFLLILTMLVFVTSGVFFDPQIEMYAAPFLWYDPMMHLVGLMRDGFYPGYSDGYLSEAYLWICAISFLFVGMIGERMTRRKRSIL